MSESSTATESTSAETATATESVDWQAEAEKWKTQSRKQEERAKANSAAARELEQLRASQMSEAEKIAAEAEQRGRSAALAEVGQRLVRAEFAARSGGRIGAEVLDDLNLAKFLTEDGDVDTTAIDKAVARLAPAPPEEPTRKPGPRPDLSQGSSSTTALNGDPLLDDLKSKLGIS
ncbi:hypothetical protein [Micromonospora sp. NBRC 107095]|uniref:hypothetical protein n=1 Tax=Micromonospora sp. NBRC 107095 TaxID=3032209 RepID=UPI00249FEFBF|nr:hypothetical protein [Micromonospora sp. NBRC 107095]GLZ62869.1 hypothetical protein Misp05_64450 [Micromonospora sp. NBRC 107095]